LERTRVILMDMPRMLHQIVTEVIANNDDLQVVDEPDRAVALATIKMSDACVVITGPEGSRPGVIGSLLGAQRVRVLALSSHGRDGVVYELQPKERLLGELSPTLLLSAIRDPLS
jgi:hypothetical protein